MKILVVGSVIFSLFLVSPVIASKYARPLTPAELAPVQLSYTLVTDGEAASKLGNYAEAEEDFRGAKDAMNWNFSADRGLAEVYVAEKRYEEAVQVYRLLLAPNPHAVSSIIQEVRTHMGFAIALSQAGHWPEAVAVYEAALPNTINWGTAPKIDVHFDPLAPMPAQLQALAHVAIGAEYSGHSEREDAFSEFGKAVQSDPNSPFANYYYVYGWRSLDPTDKALLKSPRKLLLMLATQAACGTLFSSYLQIVGIHLPVCRNSLTLPTANPALTPIIHFIQDPTQEHSLAVLLLTAMFPPAAPFDGPGITGLTSSTPININYRVSEILQTYLMYLPPGNDTCWVPLKTIDWYWSANDSIPGTTWANWDNSVDAGNIAVTGINDQITNPTWSQLVHG